ncbi:MAG TPA: protein phosphatase 2C domain-containing protein [Polyangiaceae bacterium]|nr:protein phosphatase 2C domain-containing protein [Polyangiaceae bacterium]
MLQIAPRFDYRIECAVVEEKGTVRQVHEDAHLLAPELALFAVADGMGGHAAGEVAARLALEEVRASIADRPSQRVLDAYVAKPDLETRREVFARLKRAVEKANTRVWRAALGNDSWAGMGTTLDVVWLARDHAFIAHAGDGRIYLARSRAVLQLTQDHAQIESLKATGMLSAHSKSYPDRLINALGLSESVTVDTLFVDLNLNDRLLLCSDGVYTQFASESELGDLMRGGVPDRAARHIVDRALQSGSDNATALIVQICARLVKRDTQDRGLLAQDLDRARQSALLAELSLPQVLNALSAAVQVELEAGARVPRVVASDLVAYIVLDGVLRTTGSRRVGTGALLFPESLVGVSHESELPVVEEPSRVLRLRADDFKEVCTNDPTLAAELYRHLAEHLARVAVRSP